MNRLKEAAKSLQTHLGTDTQGLRLLEKMTNIANEQRKQASAAAIEVEELKQKAARAKELLDQATAEIETLTAELRRQQDLRRATEAREKKLSAKNAELLAELHPVEEPIDAVDRAVFPTAKVVALLKELRRRFKEMPCEAGSYGIRVETIVKNYSHDEFASLGMLVAGAALMNLPISVRARITAADSRVKDWKEEYTQKYVFWSRKSFKTSALERKVSQQTIAPPGLWEKGLSTG